MEWALPLPPSHTGTPVYHGGRLGRAGGAHHIGDEQDGEAKDGGRDRVDADLNE